MLSFAAAIFLAASSPEVAVLATAPAGDFTELRFQRLGEVQPGPVVARFRHAAAESVLGASLPTRHVVVATALLGPAADRSFASSLVRLEEGQTPRILVDRVAYANRPLVTHEGRVFVQRGVAGEAPVDGLHGGRVDSLTIDEVDPDSGRARTVYSARGFTAFLAGAWGRELVVYVVDSSGGRLLAVHQDALSVRLLARVAPLARDFAVDGAGRRLVYVQGDVDGAWHVDQLNFDSGRITRLAAGPFMALLPVVLRDGSVAFSPGPGRGLERVGGGVALRALGPGFEHVTHALKGLVLGLHERPSQLPQAFAVDLATQERVALATPPDMRLDFAGVWP
jgi:hypothetical protein